jgi:hypothetical protein
VGQAADALNRFHHVVKLSADRLAEPRCPVKIGVHFVQNIRELHQHLDADVPVVLRCVVDFPAVLSQVARRLHDIEWRRGRRQNVRHERVGVQCNRGHELVEVLRR